MYAVKGGQIFTITDGVIEGGILLVDGSKIKAVGKNAAIPGGCKVFDARGRVILPGFVEAHCHVGNFNEAQGIMGFDGNEMTDPVTAHLRALDSVYPHDLGFEDARSGGISTLCVLPGSANVIGGTGVVLKARRVNDVSDMVISRYGGLKIAFGENPKGTYGHQQKKAPLTRMGVAGVFRKALVGALNYADKKKLAEKDPEKIPDRDLDKETLLAVLEGKMPLRAHAHRSDDILTAIRLAKEFGISISIEHCTEGHLVARELKRAKVPVLVGPSIVSRYKMEVKERTFKTAGILEKAGIKVAIMTDAPILPIQYLPVAAGLAQRAGMTPEGALRGITLTPAEILGVEDRVGSLTAGKDADFSIWDGHPFDTRSHLLEFYIDGKKVWKMEH
jgi:imidazolonepropionase-like amidohydrolase